MFPNRFFPRRYFPQRYFPKVGFFAWDWLEQGDYEDTTWAENEPRDTVDVEFAESDEN